VKVVSPSGGQGSGGLERLPKAEIIRWNVSWTPLLALRSILSQLRNFLLTYSLLTAYDPLHILAPFPVGLLVSLSSIHYREERPPWITCTNALGDSNNEHTP
jgi:hypothetical protein